MIQEMIQIPGSFSGEECYVHLRGCALSDTHLLYTMQYLNVQGDDDFKPPVSIQSTDGGKTWTEPYALGKMEYREDGVRYTCCDATHLISQKTGKVVICGHQVRYQKDAVVPMSDGVIHTCYYIFDPEKNTFTDSKTIEVPKDLFPRGCATGCSQFIEEENGDLLIPVIIRRTEGIHMNGAVMRCAFDGETITFREMSNELICDEGRGLYEGSLIKHQGVYYLTLRNDAYGYWSKSYDGKTFQEAKVWTWDTGDVVPTYNTQQHWLTVGGKLFLVYTRKAGNNDHVFRHRAPLFMAEVDINTMTLLRHTEQIVVPERGARLGNFGVTQVNENHAIISVSEWMQPTGCEKYGSDNSLFFTHIKAENM